MNALTPTQQEFDRAISHVSGNGSASGVDLRPPEFSDEALALRFAEIHGDELRYIAAWKKWFRWNGIRWVADDTLMAFDYARHICREAAALCDKPTIAGLVASAKTVAAVERLAKADRRHAATVDQWDTDPWLLNTPGGVVDLRTGDVRQAQSSDYLTKITSVTPEQSYPTPRWLSFLDRIMVDDTEMIAFLQRLTGYMLTGITREHALSFGYGTGANGKGVFVNTLNGILGDYHRTAPIETFTSADRDRHPTDLAGLRGARVVTATETQEGRPWDETKIKVLTGGDTISARFMRQDYFEYAPQFKLLVTGNHKPSLRSVDEAIRRRFHLIPFIVTIPPKERDLELAEKLKTEWPGILAWMLSGCLEWQRLGLAPPATVTQATEAYLEAEDALAAWIDECCTVNASAWERTSTLFGSWSTWAERNGEQRGDTKRFRGRLESRGVYHEREAGTRRAGYRGLRVNGELGRSWDA
ncbi:MAG TPA: phage/plasmid primase, P4 family [Xanthobacteraceae bacterium]|jgi:putative DNA primase/helicase